MSCRKLPDEQLIRETLPAPMSRNKNNSLSRKTIKSMNKVHKGLYMVMQTSSSKSNKGDANGLDATFKDIHREINV